MISFEIFLVMEGKEGENRMGLIWGWGCRGMSKRQNYLLYEFLNLISKGIFTLGRDCEVEFLLSDGFDIVVQVNKVCGGLKVDFAMVGVIHCFLSLLL